MKVDLFSPWSLEKYDSEAADVKMSLATPKPRRIEADMVTRCPQSHGAFTQPRAPKKSLQPKHSNRWLSFSD